MAGDEIAGRITSVAHRTTLGHPIALAYVPPRRSEPGTKVHVRVDGRLIEAVVTKLPFFDPEAERQKL